jgi:hypothetical protein
LTIRVVWEVEVGPLDLGLGASRGVQLTVSERRAAAWARGTSVSIWKNPNPWAYTIIGGIIVVVIGALVVRALGVTSSPTPTPTPGPKTPGPTPTATASAPPAAASGRIYHQGNLTVAFGTCVDLDAPPSDPQWGEASAAAFALGGVDLCSEYPSFVGYNNATLVTITSGTDTTCQNATGWLATGSYQDLNLSVGSFVCVHTNQGRFSLLRVVAINGATRAITFQVKTFK